MTSSGSQTRAKALLAACSSGDVKLVDTLLSSFGIAAPHPVIPFQYGRDFSGPGPDEPPSTQDMLLAAAESSRTTSHSPSASGSRPSPKVRTLTLLLKTFPSATVRVCHLVPLVDCEDATALELLLTHQSAAVNDEVSPGGVGLLGGALSSSDDAAMCLLRHGADPNGRDWFGRSCLQAALEKTTQSTEEKLTPNSSVVRELLARGARVDAESINAAKALQKGFIIALLHSNPDSHVVQKGLDMPSPKNVDPEAYRMIKKFISSVRH